MPEQAPRDLSGDLLPVDAPLSGPTGIIIDGDFIDLSDIKLPPDDGSAVPPDHEFFEEIVDSYPTMEQLQKRINTNISILLQRFENIMALAASEPSTFADVAVESFQLDVDVNAIIGAAEDLLCVTRQMKEMWLFGKMNTVGEDEHDIETREKMEADVLAIWKAIEEKNLLKIGLLSFGEPEEPYEKPALESSQDTTPEPSAEEDA